MSTVVYSAIFGSYDQPRAAPTISGVEFVMFTDDPTLRAPGWDVRANPAEPGQHPRMAAKRFKLLPHVYLPDAERTLWIDGGHGIIDMTGITAALACIGESGIALHRHPIRNCIYDEADASIAYSTKYGTQPIAAQAAAYRQAGHPENWGLWACGSIARMRSDRLDVVMDNWWEENLTWSYQDQISFPVVMRRAGLRPTEFPHGQYESPWFSVGGHTRHD